MQGSTGHVISLEDCGPETAPLVGGKALGLGQLVRQGHRVPPGFAVTTTAYLEAPRTPPTPPSPASTTPTYGSGGAEAAGVLLTLDPLTGDRSQVTIEAAYGLGVAVVEGEVTPDRFAVDKVTMELRSHTVGEVIELAGLDKRVEQALGVPQDIEWAVSPPGGSGGLPGWSPGGSGTRREVWLLQARPETVWSRRPRQAVGPPGSSVMDRMLGYLGRPGRSEPG